MEFKEQYKHPNWQKKRLEALTGADYVCQRCYDGDSQLHVHHKRYVKGRKIWEYATGELEVLCESCHELAHGEKEVLQSLIADLPSEAISEIISLVAGYCSVAIGPAGIETSHVIGFVGQNRVVDAGILAGLSSNTCDNALSIRLAKEIYQAKEEGREIKFSYLAQPHSYIDYRSHREEALK